MLYALISWLNITRQERWCSATFVTPLAAHHLQAILRNIAGNGGRVCWGWGLLEQPSAVCPFSCFSCYFQETSEDTSLWLGLSPVDNSLRDNLLMLRTVSSILLFSTDSADATEMLHWFCCWTPIPLLCHWALLCRRYWRYRYLIDWLIGRFNERSGNQQHPFLNQSNFYSVNIPGEARLSGPTVESVFNSKINGAMP